MQQVPRLWGLVVGGEPLTHVAGLSDTSPVMLGKLGSLGGVISGAWAKPTGTHAEVRVELLLKTPDQNLHDFLSVKLSTLAIASATTAINSTPLVEAGDTIPLSAGVELWGKLSASVENPINLIVSGTYLGTPPLREITAVGVATASSAQAIGELQLGATGNATSDNASASGIIIAGGIGAGTATSNGAIASGVASLEITGIGTTTSNGAIASGIASLEITGTGTATSGTAQAVGTQDTTLTGVATTANASASGVLTAGRLAEGAATSNNASASGVLIAGKLATGTTTSNIASASGTLVDGKLATGTATSNSASASGTMVPPYATRAITITNSGSSLTNYPLKVTFDTATPIASSKMRSDGNDIRFYSDSGGTTELTYYIESGFNSSSTNFYVLVPTIANGTSTIYCRYNTGLTTAVSTRAAIASSLNTAVTQLWITSRDLNLANNALVTSVPDRSVSNTSISQNVTSQKPVFNTNQLDGSGAIVFEGTDDILLFTLPSVTSLTALVVFAFTNASEARGISIAYAGDNRGYSLSVRSSAYSVVADGVGWTTGSVSADTSPHLHTLKGTTNSNLEVFLDNAGSSYLNNTNALPFGSNYAIGGHPGVSGLHQAMKLYEAIYLNSNSTDITNIKHYLNQAYPSINITSRPSVTVGAES